MTGIEAGPATSRTIRAARQAIRSGETSAAALAEEYYRIISAEDSKIHAWLSLSRERALEQAARIDATGGERR